MCQNTYQRVFIGWAVLVCRRSRQSRECQSRWFGFATGKSNQYHKQPNCWWCHHSRNHVCLYKYGVVACALAILKYQQCTLVLVLSIHPKIVPICRPSYFAILDPPTTEREVPVPAPLTRKTRPSSYDAQSDGRPPRKPIFICVVDDQGTSVSHDTRRAIPSINLHVLRTRVTTRTTRIVRVCVCVCVCGCVVFVGCVGLVGSVYACAFIIHDASPLPVAFKDRVQWDTYHGCVCDLWIEASKWPTQVLGFWVGRFLFRGTKFRHATTVPPHERTSCTEKKKRRKKKKALSRTTRYRAKRRIPACGILIY